MMNFALVLLGLALFGTGVFIFDATIAINLRTGFHSPIFMLITDHQPIVLPVLAAVSVALVHSSPFSLSQIASSALCAGVMMAVIAIPQLSGIVDQYSTLLNCSREVQGAQFQICTSEHQNIGRLAIVMSVGQVVHGYIVPAMIAAATVHALVGLIHDLVHRRAASN